MSLFYKDNVKQLGELTALVRGKLSSLERKALTALITIDVHNRYPGLLKFTHHICAHSPRPSASLLL